MPLLEATVGKMPPHAHLGHRDRSYIQNTNTGRPDLWKASGFWLLLEYLWWTVFIIFLPFIKPSNRSVHTDRSVTAKTDFPVFHCSKIHKQVIMKTFVQEVQVKPLRYLKNLLCKVTLRWRPSVCCVEQNCTILVTMFSSSQWGASINIPCPPYLWVFISHTQTLTYVHKGCVMWYSRGCYYAPALGLWTLLGCWCVTAHGLGRGVGSSEGSSALSPMPGGSWVHSCCPVMGLSAVTMGSSGIKPPLPCWEKQVHHRTMEEMEWGRGDR